MSPRLVAFDLDGTLAESKQRMTPEMGALLGRLLEKVPVAVMSGAGFSQFQTQFLTALPASARLERLYIFPTSAAECFSHTGGSWQRLYDNELAAEEKKKVLSALEQALAECGMAEAPERFWGERIEDRGAQISFSALGQQAPVPEKEAWHAQNDPMRQKLRDRLAQLLPEFSVRTGGLTTIDITRRGITKAYGLERLSKIARIPVADMLYVGDALQPGGNDAVVCGTPVQTKAVKGPSDTARIIRAVIDASSADPVMKKGETRQDHYSSSSIMKNGTLIAVVVILLAVAGLAYYFYFLPPQAPAPQNGSGNGTTTGAATTTDANNLIQVTFPRANDIVTTPLIVTGSARGNWYFEASFPVTLKDADGNILAQVPAQAQGEWMTTDFVPFSATITFTPPRTQTGVLILQKDNPSGLPEFDDQIEIPVRFFSLR